MLQRWFCITHRSRNRAVCMCSIWQLETFKIIHPREKSQKSRHSKHFLNVWCVQKIVNFFFICSFWRKAPQWLRRIWVMWFSRAICRSSRQLFTHKKIISIKWTNYLALLTFFFYKLTESISIFWCQLNLNRQNHLNRPHNIWYTFPCQTRVNWQPINIENRKSLRLEKTNTNGEKKNPLIYCRCWWTITQQCVDFVPN